MDNPFIIGPYTTPHPETGVPVLDSRVKWVVGFVLFFFFGIGCLVGVSTGNAANDQLPERTSIPECETPTGETQNVCKVKIGPGSEVIYLDHGAYMYDVTNSLMHTPK